MLELISLLSFACVLFVLMGDVGRFLCLCLRPSPALAAENLFLRTQLVLYQERHTKPRRATNAIRMSLVWLSRLFDWRQALVIVQPATLIRWHRQAFRRFWRWKSCPGRPPIPAELQALIRQMACDNPTWGQERIANELLLKLGLRVSPRTVRTYMPKRLNRGSGKRAVVYINRAGNKSGLLQVNLPALTDAVWPLYHRTFIAPATRNSHMRRNLPLATPHPQPPEALNPSVFGATGERDT